MNDISAEDQGKNAIDVEALKQKYQQEREKRIRANGRDQYRVVDAQHSAVFLDDPYTLPISSSNGT